MKKNDDMMTDLILRKSKGEDEKLTLQQKNKLSAQIDAIQTTKKKTGSAYAACALMTVIAVILLIVCVVIPGNSNRVVSPDNYNTVELQPTETISGSTKINEPVYFAAMKCDWYDAKSTTSYVYREKEDKYLNDTYFELTIDIKNQCYYMEVNHISSNYGADYDSAKNIMFDTDEKKKLSVYLFFYEAAYETYAFEFEEYKEVLLREYENMAVFAEDYPSYLKEGIRMAADDIRQGKQYVFNFSFDNSRNECNIYRKSLENINFNPVEEIDRNSGESYPYFTESSDIKMSSIIYPGDSKDVKLFKHTMIIDDREHIVYYIQP